MADAVEPVDVVDPALPVQEPASTSIAAHRALLETPVPPSPDDEPEPAPPVPEPKPRHRAQSQTATPDDVTTINALTKELRTLEDAIGKDITKQDGESPRVYKLRRSLEITKRLQEQAAKPAPVETPRPAVQPQAPPSIPIAAPAAFAFPPFDDAWLAANPGKDWNAYNQEQMSAFYKHARQAEQFETQQTTQTNQQKAYAEQAQQRAQQLESAYQTKLASFVKTHPDFQEKLTAPGSVQVPDVMLVALKLADNGPELVYNLFQHPELLAEMHLLGEGKQVTDASVASAQRWLQARVPTGSTGAVAAPPVLPSVPRPPTPVRTGPVTPSDTPPGDTASLSAHRSYYGPKGNRRH